MTMPSDPHGCWLCRGLAGTVAGFALALAASGVFAWAGPDGPDKYQLVMWMIAPVWFAVLGASFLFSSAARAWLWLGGAAALAHAGLVLCRHLGR